MAIKSTMKLTRANDSGGSFSKSRKFKKSVRPRSKNNVYEYSSAPLKGRSREDYSLTTEEKAGHSRDVEEDDNGMSHVKRRIIDTVTGDTTNLDLEGDEDEDIDSDDAFEETDEERFAEFRFNKKAGQKVCTMCSSPLISSQ
jgi:U3 small nucleolar RNA-associated protein 14